MTEITEIAEPLSNEAGATALRDRLGAAAAKKAPPPPASRGAARPAPAPARAAAPEPAPEALDDMAASAAAAFETAPVARHAPATEAPAPAQVSAPMAEPSRDEAPAEPAAPPEPELKAEILPADFQLDSRAAVSALEALSAIQNMTKDAPSFKVALLQSGFTVEVTPLHYRDMTRLLASSSDNYASQVRLLRTAHRQIVSWSCPPMDFDAFVDNCAHGDKETLLYGLYGATYPGDSEFDVPCKHCGHINKVRFGVSSIVRAEDPAVYGEIARLLDPSTDFKGAVQKSTVNDTRRVRLPGGMIVTVQNPPLRVFLANLQRFAALNDPKTGQVRTEAEGLDSIISISMYIKEVHLPDPKGRGYISITDGAQKLDAISKLLGDDPAQLQLAIGKIVKELEVTYRMPAFNCAACTKVNDKMELSIEEVLFTKLQGRA